jgi:hypothetical protein
VPRKDEYRDNEMPPGLAWRSAVSIAVFIGWLIFLVLFLFFYAQNFNIYQNIAIFIVSVLVVVAILGPMWAYWGMRNAYRWERRGMRRRRARR